MSDDALNRNITVSGAVLGDTIDYANNQRAEILQANPSLELKLGRRINTTIDYSMRQLRWIEHHVRQMLRGREGPVEATTTRSISCARANAATRVEARSLSEPVGLAVSSILKRL